MKLRYVHLSEFPGSPRLAVPVPGGLSTIGGPLLSRIDPHVRVPAVPHREMRRPDAGATSAETRDRVARVRGVHRSPSHMRIVRHLPAGSASEELLRPEYPIMLDSRFKERHNRI